MKKTIFIVGLLLIGCSKVQDDSSKECIQNCTVIEGYITSLNNEPLKNILVEFNNDKSLPYESNIRKIAKSKTDENGYYRMSFFLEDEELGEEALGSFEILMDFSSLDTTQYFFSKNIEIRKGYFVSNLNSIDQRDTTLVKDFYVPQKTFVTINLNGFNPVQNEDFYKAEVCFPIGFRVEEDVENTVFEYGPAKGEVIMASELDNEFVNVSVAAGDFNLLKVEKRKDGVLISKEISFFVPEEGGISITDEF